MPLSASQLRANIYKLLDRVIEKGEAIEIRRRGKLVRIVADRPSSKLSRLIKRPNTIKGNPDELIHLDWSKEWLP